jgi:hypothetical protein
MHSSKSTDAIYIENIGKQSASKLGQAVAFANLVSWAWLMRSVRDLSSTLQWQSLFAGPHQV